MKSPFVYGKNLLHIFGLRLLHGLYFKAGWIQSFQSLKTELKNGGTITLGSYNQNRGKIYLISDGGKLTVGSHCFFNTGCCISCMESIRIEDHCKFGNNLVIVDHDHNFREKTPEFLSAPILVGADTWVGANVTILRGTKIGRGCVIAAGSVVSGVIPDHTVLIQKRSNEFHALSATTPTPSS